jgi:hypothetical protein
MLNAPTIIRTGNLVSDLLNCKTREFPSVNAAKRFIRHELKPKRGKLQSMIFPSRIERRKALWRMHQQLNTR